MNCQRGLTSFFNFHVKFSQHDHQKVCIFKWFSIFFTFLTVICLILSTGNLVSSDFPRNFLSDITLEHKLELIVTIFILAYQILFASALEKEIREDLLNTQAEGELNENFDDRSRARRHRAAISLQMPRIEFSTSHSDEVITPPPNYDVLTPPPTFEEVSEGFLFQSKIKN